jgi:hypothetical protein
MSNSSPTSPARQLLDRFKRDGWRFRRDELAKAVACDSASVIEFMRLAIDEFPPGKTFLCDLDGYLPASSFGAMARHAVEALRRGVENDAAARVVARLSLESPRQLHPWLDELFALRPNASTYYAAYPWRESADAQLDFLLAKAKTAPADDARFAVEALLESRTPHALASVAALGLEKWRPHFLVAGYEPAFDAMRPLYDPRVRHLSPLSHPKNVERFADGAAHPTWQCGETHPRRRFGGRGRHTCVACGKANHHLVTLEAADFPSNVTSRPRLSLESCLSCLGWAADILYYTHDADGVPLGGHFEGGVEEPQFPAEPFPEMQVALVPTGSRWIWQDWGLSGGENLHRLGGHPCWVQDAGYSECPQCERMMTFLLQLDSYLPHGEGNEWLWGSGGICYVLWCDDCAVSAMFWQCT